MPQILLFNASNSSQSIQKPLLDAAAKLLTEYDIVQSNSADFDLPIYSTDLENSTGIPQAAADFYQMIGQCDALILACPEHNGSMPAVFKNLFDWTTRHAGRQQIPTFQNKPGLILTASPGSRGGLSVRTYLEQILPFHGLEVLAAHGFPNFSQRPLNAAEHQTLDEAVSLLRQRLKTA